MARRADFAIAAALAIGCGTPSPPMVAIPAGTFTMGCIADSEFVCSESSTDEERPAHEVTLDAFELDEFEVTASDFLACVNAGKCSYHTPPDGEACMLTVNGSVRLSASGSASRPANCVTWGEARSFCEWLGRRLPTEAEWERAARFPDGRIFPWGTELPTCAFAAFTEGGCTHAEPAEVGTHATGRAGSGAQDLAGNVAEWVFDFFASDAYARTSSSNPAGPTSGTSHVIRGGGWDTGSSRLRASSRDSLLAVVVENARAAGVGFRCARSQAR